MTLRHRLIASLGIPALLHQTLLAAPPVAADPMILLNNAQVKCLSVEAPADALLNIEYEAPDLITPGDVPGEDGKAADPRAYRRLRTTITVAQEGGRDHHGNRNDHGRNVDKGRNRREKDDKLVKDLETKRGSIQYVTTHDGQVTICIQSLTASAVSPTPISVRVTESPAGEESVGEPSEKTAPEGQQLDSKSQQNAMAHFSQLERTLAGLISKTDMILRQADYAKELEVEFHEQSIAMNKASQWWPIVQLCVLLVTGFTQANHMVQFFRKHHIF